MVEPEDDDDDDDEAAADEWPAGLLDGEWTGAFIVTAFLRMRMRGDVGVKNEENRGLRPNPESRRYICVTRNRWHVKRFRV